MRQKTPSAPPSTPLIPRWAALGPAAGLLTLCLSCGGSGSPTASSTTVAYVDPATTGYRLVRDASSSGAHLVLDLLGPSGTQLKGLLFELGLDGSKAAWGDPGGSDPYLRNGAVLNLGSGIPLLKSQVSGPTLTAAIYQKGTTAAATLGTQALVSVALDVDGGATGSISLTVVSAQVLDGTGTLQTVPVAVGTLSAQ
jgi:hypothetical protein